MLFCSPRAEATRKAIIVREGGDSGRRLARRNVRRLRIAVNDSWSMSGIERIRTGRRQAILAGAIQYRAREPAEHLIDAEPVIRTFDVYTSTGHKIAAGKAA